MMTGHDPGRLGYYGFRNRADRSYGRMATATSLAVNEPLLWDRLGDAGNDSILIGVPQTYPPRPVRGLLVTDFLTPSIESQYTYPADLKAEIARMPEVHPYEFDVADFRTDDKASIRDAIVRMTDKRFALARRLLTTKPWDFFMMVEMGTDRVHHAFWQFMDPRHHRFVPGNPFESVIEDYYVHLDRKIGELLELFPGETTVLVVSDHGGQCMEGGIALNEWLVREGYLALQEAPRTPTRLEGLKVDWARTRAWGSGGYYGRVFLNVKGREPHGAVDPADYESLRSELVEKLEAIGDPQGRPIGTRRCDPRTCTERSGGPRLPTFSCILATSDGGPWASSAAARSTRSRTTPGPTTPTTRPTAS